MSVYPSEITLGFGIIRMYEHKTCEVPLLPCRYSSIWAPASSMLQLQTDLDNSTEEARSASNSNAAQYFQPSISGKIHPSTFDSTTSWHAFAEPSVPIPPSVAQSCDSAQLAKPSSGTFDSSGRWTAIPLSQKAMGTVFDRGEILFRKNCRLFRSHASPRQGRCLPMGASFGRSARKRSGTDSGVSRRQFERHEENCQKARLGPSALPFPSDTEIAGPMEAPPGELSKAERSAKCSTN